MKGVLTMKHLQSLAVALIFLWAVLTDGVVAQFGMGGWMASAVIVLGLSYICIRLGDYYA